MTSCCNPETFGADPISIKWNVVRGDKASLRIEFLNNDEVTYFDTSDWEFKSWSYDPRGDILDELEVVSHNGYVDIIANSDITQYWGTGYSSVVAELPFDLQVTLADSTVWTPVIGVIRVLGDVSGGSL
ncbi:MAG: hypothetical protein ACKOXF_07110 [Chitinophagaceae bacterium]